MALTVLLGGCGMSRDQFQSELEPGAAAGVTQFTSFHATPVPPAIGHVLGTAPRGEPLDYQIAGGRTVGLVLGPPYNSGLGVPCRIGHVGVAGYADGAPTAYAFCHSGNQWYEMDPVVVSGY